MDAGIPSWQEKPPVTKVALSALGREAQLAFLQLARVD